MSAKINHTYYDYLRLPVHIGSFGSGLKKTILNWFIKIVLDWYISDWQLPSRHVEKLL